MYLRLVALCFFLAAAAGPARAESYCALVVSVTDSARQRSRGASLELRSQDGEKRFAKAEWGEARFCDFGFGDHELVLNPGGCNERMIRGIRNIWGHEQKVSFVVDECTSHPHRYGANGCELWVRVLDADGKGISGARIAGFSDAASDEYGRLRSAVLWGAERELTIEADGYQPGRITVDCANGSTTRIETTVVLDVANPPAIP